MNIDKLLLIDDDDLSNFIVNSILEEIHLVGHLDFKTDGESALAFLHTCEAAHTFPNIILVDLKMPIMDGFEFIEQYEIKFYSNHPDTQLMVLTSSTREVEKQKALHFTSVTQFINKPLNEEKLKLVIDLFKNKQSTNNS